MIPVQKPRSQSHNRGSNRSRKECHRSKTRCFRKFSRIISMSNSLKSSKLIIPQRETSTFISSIGHLDGRINLYETSDFGGRITMGNKSLMDLCIMASKLAYENVALV